MAFIKCPRCGQTVLSVASKCPKCAYLLLQAPTPQGDEREFARCRRCGKTIPRMAPVCEYCDYPQLSRRRLRRVLGAASVVCVVIAGLVGARAINQPDDSSPVHQPGPSVLPQERAEPLATPQDPIGDSLPIAPPVAARPTVPPSAEETSREPAIVRVRWTVNWANVRQAPGTDQPIVAVLRPRARVTVRNPTRGWWLVSVNGQEMGYVAGNLLTDEPPAP